MSPRVAVIFKPDAAQSYYLSYGTSYNPVIEYLIVAPSDQSLAPEKNSTVELGTKVKILSGKAELTAALFDTRVDNARNSDPDDPTVQQMPFDQRVKGVELGINGYLTEDLGAYRQLHSLERQDHGHQRSSGAGQIGAQYAARCVQFLEHRGTDAGLDDRRRLHRHEPSLCGYGQYGRRARRTWSSMR